MLSHVPGSELPTTEVTAPELGMVLYCDGGARPTNPGFIGFGIHGYLFEASAPKKGTGNSDVVCLMDGYFPKSDYTQLITADGYTEVPPSIPDWIISHEKHRGGKAASFSVITPIEYFDGFGSPIGQHSNNVAELQGAVTALAKASEYNIKLLVIRTDSEYVVENANRNLYRWMRNGWVKDDGQPVKNINYWQQLLGNIDVLVKRGVKVVFKWIRGHDDSLGNELADWYATVGVTASMAGKTLSVIESSPSDGYWKTENESHPLISYRNMYFNSQAEYSEPGVYYIGEHGSEDYLNGKRQSEGAHAIVRVATPEPMIELMKEHVFQEAGLTDSILIASLDMLYRPSNFRLLERFGRYAMGPAKNGRLNITMATKDQLIREQRPPRLSARTIDAIRDLDSRLNLYLSDDASIVVTDLTGELYEIITKSGKKADVQETKLRPHLNVGFSKLEVVCGYTKECPEGNAVRDTADVTLVLGIDLPNRNALKRLETLEPKIKLITWKEAPEVFRYAVVIECATGIGIYAGSYSNIRYIVER